MAAGRLYADIEKVFGLYRDARALVSGITDQLLTLTDDGDSVFDAAYSLADGEFQDPEEFLKEALGPGYKAVLEEGMPAGAEDEKQVQNGLPAEHAADLAGYIVRKAIDDGRPVTNLQLQAALYMVQEHFAGLGGRAFYDRIEAWGCGPVVPDVYHHYHGMYGDMPVYSCPSGSGTLQLSMEEKAAVDSIIREVTAIGFQDRYALIIGEGSAWQKVYNGRTGFRKTIPLRIIKSCIPKNVLRAIGPAAMTGPRN